MGLACVVPAACLVNFAGLKNMLLSNEVKHFIGQDLLLLSTLNVTQALSTPAFKMSKIFFIT